MYQHLLFQAEYWHFICSVTAHLTDFLWFFVTGWFPAKFVEILDERSKEVRMFLYPIYEANDLFIYSFLQFTECVMFNSRHLFPQYSLAGDDSVTEAVTDLARGTLCPALKAIFQHGLKKPSILGGPCHPWLFIEEVGEFLSFLFLFFNPHGTTLPTAVI